MNIIKAHNLVCPLDNTPLTRTEKQMICENGHAFDIARQGYVNLLSVQHKRSKEPGDSKEMVLARKQFLNSGYYAPVAEKLNELVLSNCTGGTTMCLLDAGCGEGYYLDVISRLLSKSNINTDIAFVGLDISKEAIVEAAKRNKQICWLVGTNRKPPVSVESVDVICCVFGFPSFESFYSILKPGGKIILVEPGNDHLKELREIIYSEVKKSVPADLACLETMGLKLIDVQPLQFKITALDKEQLHNLLLMTPHFYRANQAGREKALQLSSLDVTVDVMFRVLEKSA